MEEANFLGPNGTCFARCHFRAQKSLFSLPTPSSGPPASKSLPPRHINTRFINSYNISFAAMELRDKGKYGFLLPPELIIPVGEYRI
jgi:hypothetical protein